MIVVEIYICYSVLHTYTRFPCLSTSDIKDFKDKNGNL